MTLSPPGAAAGALIARVDSGFEFRHRNWSARHWSQGDARTEKTAHASIREDIENPVHSDQQLWAKGAALAEADRGQLRRVKLELDQFWDLLRQRQALIDAGKAPRQAQVRPVDLVDR